MKKFFFDKLPIVISIIGVVLLLWFAFGCQPTTQSLINPERKVTRQELNWEVETLLAKSKIRIAELDHQEELRNLIFQQTLVIAESGTINPLGIVTSILAIIGLGATADDIRLRKQRARANDTNL